ncbi:MAG TPA: ribonuclease H family protein [Bacteroidia bacterium]|nr:ribonuclease H family protein [Bacteroidia bacterium]
MASAKKKYYVVWKGRQTGVFDSWEKCKQQIGGFTGAIYKSFSSLQQANTAYENPAQNFIGKTSFVSELSQEQLEKIGKPIQESICVDASFNGKEMEYKGVYTKDKKELFRSGIFEDATNNIGEFLAIVHALGYLKKQNSKAPVYSDSITAMKWVRDKHANTKLTTTKKNQSLFYLIERAEKWLKDNSYSNKLLKWETKAWGEIPADFGRK